MEDSIRSLVKDSLYTQVVAFICDIEFAEISPTKERRDSLMYQVQRKVLIRKADSELLSTFEQYLIDHMELDQNPAHKRSFICALSDILNICQNMRGNHQIENLVRIRLTYSKNKVYSITNINMVEMITYVLANTLNVIYNHFYPRKRQSDRV